MTNNTKLILIGLIIILGLMGTIIGNHSSFEDDLEALKPTKRETQVKLSVFKKMVKPTDNTSLKSIIKNIKTGDKLGFKISTNLPIYMAFLVSINKQTPEVLLKNSRIPPGKNKSLDVEGMSFTYEVIENQQTLKFCLIHDDNAKDLRLNLLKIKESWSNIPDSLCVSALSI